jgi:phosphoribosylaminoimidazolecarboxamide formyltransferase / IMP cyclohydrolase
MADDLKKAYRTIMDDHFPEKMSITFGEGQAAQTIAYEKVSWVVDEVEKGLRYGENPGQEAAMFRPVNGNLVIGESETIAPGRYLASDIELLQAGKHPGKTNITDADNGLNILRYFPDKPTVAILKHNNPCGVAQAGNPAEAYVNADAADRIAAFGGAICINRPVDKDTATEINKRYAEVVVAPDYEDGALDILAQRKTLRIVRVARMDKLHDFVGARVVDFKSLIDGAIIAQLSFVPKARTKEELILAETEYKGQAYKIDRLPTEAEYADMLFGWLVESGITSNSVIYVKNLTTVGIGTGEQDRVGVAEIARDKAYRKLADRICFDAMNTPYNDVLREDEAKAQEFWQQAVEQKGGLLGSTMVSDAFFPFRDGIEVGLNEGVKAVIQPGGSMNDYESIQACNDHGATMVFTGQRSFKH